MKKANSGFTIVELLIVIVVIAILAAISVVAYTGIQERARTSAHASAATQTEKAIMTYALQTNGESVSLSNSLVGYKEGAGDINLLKPLGGTPDITMYAVYSVTGTSLNYPTIARLNPATTGSQLFQLNTGPSGTSQMNFRIDTPGQVNSTGSTSGLRIPGNTVIGWVQVSNGATSRSYGYNNATGSTAALNPGGGWTTAFTSFSLMDNDGTNRIGLVFNAVHDQATRQQVINWLAQKYGVSL